LFIRPERRGGGEGGEKGKKRLLGEVRGWRRGTEGGNGFRRIPGGKKRGARKSQNEGKKKEGGKGKKREKNVVNLSQSSSPGRRKKRKDPRKERKRKEILTIEEGGRGKRSKDMPRHESAEIVGKKKGKKERAAG